jgi:serine/threonine protein kinase
MSELYPGTVLEGKYRVQRLLGEGGMNRVYLVEDLAATKKWALKLTRGTEEIQSTQQDMYNKFLKEISILTTLKHPSLPVIEDYFPHGAQYCIVEEYIEGEPLDEYARHNLPSEAEVLGWSVTICDVLQLLHKNDIIFRDLKPGNLILTKTGTIKMIDFGIARYYKHGKAVDTELLGTPGYAAPETYGRAQSDARSDIYSLGATMHHLLTGVDPQDKPFHFEHLLKLRSGLSHSTCAMIMRMLENKPQERYPSISEVRREIESIRKILPASAGPSSKPSYGAGASPAPPSVKPSVSYPSLSPQPQSSPVLKTIVNIVIWVGILYLIGLFLHSDRQQTPDPTPYESPRRTPVSSPSPAPSPAPINLDAGDFSSTSVPIAPSTPGLEWMQDRGDWSRPMGSTARIWPDTYYTYPAKMTDPQIELSSDVARPGEYLTVKFNFKVHYHPMYSKDPWVHKIYVFFAMPDTDTYTMNGQTGWFQMIPGSVAQYRMVSVDTFSGNSSMVTIPVVSDDRYVCGAIRWKPDDTVPPLKYDATLKWRGPRVVLHVENSYYSWIYTKGFIVGARKK